MRLLAHGSTHYGERQPAVPKPPPPVRVSCMYRGVFGRYVPYTAATATATTAAATAAAATATAAAAGRVAAADRWDRRDTTAPIGRDRPVSAIFPVDSRSVSVPGAVAGAELAQDTSADTHMIRQRDTDTAVVTI